MEGNAMKNKPFDTSSESQRERLLSWLRDKPITTLEARRELDILMPAARIYELRHLQGFNIHLTWIDAETLCGVKHRIGKYSLLAGKWREGNE